MNTLLSSEMSASDKKAILKDEFRIAMTKTLESEVSDMCNLSEGIREDGIALGKKQGMKQGIEQGIEQGMKQGIEQGKLSLLAALVENRILTVPVAAAQVNLTEEEFLLKIQTLKNEKK